MNQITVELRDVYGKPTVYPVCEKAKLFAQIAGTKTLTFPVCEAISNMGFTILVKDRGGEMVFETREIA